MPTIVNPMDALPSFQIGILTGEIELVRGSVDQTLFAYVDNPDGTRPRYSYARLEDGRVMALAMATHAGAENGVHFMQIGYAVPEDLRGQGRAKEIARAVIAELRNGLGEAGVESFYVEAVAGVDNLASQRVAAAVIGGEPTPITDENSGEAALQYKTLIHTEASMG